MPLTKQSHPTGRASLFGAVLGIVLVAVAVVAIALTAVNWPASWPGLLIVVALVCIDVVLITRHMSRHSAGQG